MPLPPSTASLPPDQPYCGNCGYLLTGLTNSAHCPECGKPIVDTLRRNAFYPNTGKRYRSAATFLGYPVLDIALGPANGKLRGHAKGLIAIGDIATGGIAIGGVSHGIVALGGVSVGLFSLGGCSLGLIAASGGLAIGALAQGGCAIGALSIGGTAVGIYARGAAALGFFTHDVRTRILPIGAPDPFAPVRWFFGNPRWPVSIQPTLIILAITLLAAATILFLASISHLRQRNATPPTHQ